MLSFYNSDRNGRREFLRVGGLALGGMTLAGLNRIQRAHAGHDPLGGVLKNKSVVFLFMHGGPSQTETFDPNMGAPSEIASATGEVQTSIPGVTFGGTFPKLAQLADRLTVVRSFRTGDGNHDIKPIVGSATGDANLGSIYSYVAGQNQPITGMPTNVALYPQAVDDSTRPTTFNFGNFEATGSLGASCAPFAPSAGSTMRENMELTIPMDRLDDRRLLLLGLDRMQRSLEAEQIWDSMNGLRRQSFDTILGGAAEAFDLSQEDATTIARYDTSTLVRPDQISRQWNNYDNYVDNAKSLGKLLLMSRRLVERGCRFVTITTNFVWDMHSDSNNAGVEEGMRYMGLPLDHAVSTFITDLEERGMLDDVLLVCCGEMGRTPRINERGGRDHWGGLAPLLLAGGGITKGQVIGQSARDNSEPLSEPVTIPHLVASVLQTLFDVGELRLLQGLPRNVLEVASHAPIPGLWG